jgi:hypothetical protein
LVKGARVVPDVRVLFEIPVGKPEIFPREEILLVPKKGKPAVVVPPVQGISCKYHGEGVQDFEKSLRRDRGWVMCPLQERPASIMKNEATLPVDFATCQYTKLVFIWICIARVVPSSVVVLRCDEAGRLWIVVEADSGNINTLLSTRAHYQWKIVLAEMTKCPTFQLGGQQGCDGTYRHGTDSSMKQGLPQQ